MKKFILLLTLSFAFTTLMFAGSKNSAKVNLLEKVTVGSTTLQPGEYKVTWTDAGQVTFLQGKNSIATVSGTVKPEGNSQVGVITSTEGSTTTLNSLRLKTATVTFNESSKTAH